MKPERCHRAFTLEVAAKLRRLDCRHYNRCLDKAAAEKWNGFRCGEGCYKKPSDMQTICDAAGLLKIAKQVVGL